MKKTAFAILVFGALLVAPTSMAEEHGWSAASLWEEIVTSVVEALNLDIEAAVQASDGGPLVDPVGEPVTDGGPLIDPVGLGDDADGNGSGS